MQGGDNINAKIKLQNENTIQINDLQKITYKTDNQSYEETFPEFIFYGSYFYNFIGKENSLCVWGRDIHHVEFSTATN